MKNTVTIERYITAAHGALALAEKTEGRKLYDTFGEWRKEHPNHPAAKKNYPDNEYLQVISAFKAYFDKKALESDVYELTL